MKIKLLFTGVCFCSLSYLSYGQTQTPSPKEPVPLVVSSNSGLNAQRSKLDSKQAEINQAVTSSRGQMNQLNEEFRILKEDYVKMLQAEQEKTTDAQLKVQLQEEITRYSGTTNSQTR